MDGPPSRRAVLAATAGTLGALAGCSSDGSAGAGSVQTSTSATPSPTTSSPSESATAVPRCVSETTLEALRPEPPLADPDTVEAVAGDCPPGPAPTIERVCERGFFPRACEEREPPSIRVVCSPAASAPFRMEVESRHLDLPGRLGLTVANGTNSTVRTNFYRWYLWKRVDGAWHNVAPSSSNSPLHRLEPGGTHHYCVSLDNTSAAGRRLTGVSDPDSPPNREEWSLSVPALGGGEYAFGLFGSFEGNNLDQKTAAVARFSLGGDPVTVTRTGIVEDISRDGGRVSGVWTYERDAEHGDPYEFELRRIDSDRETVRLLPEMLLRSYSWMPIRDMVALSREYDAEIVRIRAWNFGVVSSAPPGFPFSVDGQEYETSVREL